MTPAGANRYDRRHGVSSVKTLRELQNASQADESLSKRSKTGDQRFGMRLLQPLSD